MLLPAGYKHKGEFQQASGRLTSGCGGMQQSATPRNLLPVTLPSHKITLTLNNSRISKRSPWNGPVFMVHHKPETLNQTSKPLQGKFACKAVWGTVYTVWQNAVSNAIATNNSSMQRQERWGGTCSGERDRTLLRPIRCLWCMLPLESTLISVAAAARNPVDVCSPCYHWKPCRCLSCKVMLMFEIPAATGTLLLSVTHDALEAYWCFWPVQLLRAMMVYMTHPAAYYPSQKNR